MERAFLFAAHAVDDLARVANSLNDEGHLQLATRIQQGLAAAAQAGLARVSVVRDFPIALVGYGYTREYNDPIRAQLLPLPHDGSNSAKLPLVAVEARTEGLLVELDPRTLWQWCGRNAWSEPPPAGVTDLQARAWLLNNTYANEEGPAAVAI